MRSPVALRVLVTASASAMVFGAGVAAAAPSSGWTPTAWLGEAAVVAFAFALPALLAGSYLLAKRVLAGMRDHLGLTIAAAGLVIAAVAALYIGDVPGAVKIAGIAGG